MPTRAILCPKYDSVDWVNESELQLINTDQQTYLSCDSIVNDKDCAFIPVEFLNSVEASGMPPH